MNKEKKHKSATQQKLNSSY